MATASAQTAGAGIYYAPDGDARGARIEFSVGAQALLLQTAHGQRRVSLSALTLERGGFDHAQINLQWRDTDGEHRLYLDDATRTAWLAQPPTALASLIAPARRGIRNTRTRFNIGVAIATLIVALPLLLLLAFWFYADHAVDWAVAKISPETEVALGEQVFAHSMVGLREVKSGAALDVVQELGARLTRAQNFPYRVQWHVVQNDAVNAFAVPGGHIVVFTGLLKTAESAEEVAGVLAHEVQHIALRHSLKGMVRNAGWQALFSFTFGSWSSGTVGALAQELGSLKFSRDQEREADRRGLELLQQARIDARGMVQFFDKLARSEAQGVALLSTHPASAERRAALEQAVSQTDTQPPLPYAWAKIKAQL